MAKLGKERKFYIVSGSPTSTYTALSGEQTNSFNRAADAIEVSDKTTSWKEFIAGVRGATADVTVYTDDTNTQQKAMMDAFEDGATVNCFVGILGTGSTPSEGDAFAALITGISDSNDNGSVATRNISLQVTGAVTHYPTS